MAKLSGGGFRLPFLVQDRHGVRWACLAFVLLLTGCGPVLALRDFEATGPVLDPVAFFTGSLRSWGVLERSGTPTAMVVTECEGEAEGDEVRMTQIVRVGDDPAVTRRWVMRRVAPGRFEATANDMVGTATGVASGRAFHWTWTLALSPGNPLRDVTMDQWWYLLDDGAMLNRTQVLKLGITLAEITEHFSRQQPGG